MWKSLRSMFYVLGLIKEDKSLVRENVEEVTNNFSEIVKMNRTDFMKFLANTIQGELNVKSFYNDRSYEYLTYEKYFKNSFLLNMSRDGIETIDEIISIKDTPVISMVWQPERIKDCYISICEKCNRSFDIHEAENNVKGILVEPLGIVLVYQGNHSVNSAIIHNEGEIHVKEKVDITSVLQKYRFDGMGYVSLDSGKYINCKDMLDGYRPLTHTMGVLYETVRKSIL